jgi:hypothetical protein
MAQADVLPGWSRQHYRTAIEKAITRKWLERIDEKQVPRRYRLAPFAKREVGS